MPDFVHLHNHTHYSILDSINTVDQLVGAAINDGQKAVGITDHGVMFGCYQFYNECKKKKIKPILGFEAYVSTGSRFEKDAGKKSNDKKNYFHLVLLAKDLQGYHNLMKLTTLAHTEGYYYKPRIDRELIEKYKNGLIASSACLNGVVNAHLVSGDRTAAYEAAKYYKDLFEDDFYLELQNHGLVGDEIVLKEIPKISQELGIPMLVTNDVHYLSKDDSLYHNVHLTIRDSNAANSGKIDIYDLKYKVPEFYYKSSEEMYKLFKDFPDALKNTIEVADKCDVNFEKKLFMPQINIPKDSKSTNLEDYLEELTYKGLEKKLGILNNEYKQRVKYELSVINKMGFPGYFLIVTDFCKAARAMNIRIGPGRGSAAGSLVAFGLDITNIDPMPYDLLFERFLNPERVSMPDIDIDFCDKDRDRVIDYVKSKYGKDSVAQIITYNKMTSKAVLTDVGRVLGISIPQIKEITKKIPTIFGKVMKISEVIKEVKDLKWLANPADDRIKELIDISKKLENRIRSSGTHAAGVIIAPGDVSNYVPLYKSQKEKDQSIGVVSQYSMKDIESAGLLKMDFLGLKTLSTIDDTLTMIHANHGIEIDLDNLEQVPFDDPKTYELIGNGNTLAIFQFESSGMQDYLRQLKPHNIEELAAMNALYRPGPMSNIPEFIDRKYGRKKVEYIHSLMEDSLKLTYGIIVYQEQVMQLTRDIGGFSLGQSDVLRRAMGKKDRLIMDKMQPQFEEAAIEKGLTLAQTKAIWDLIDKFADYGFNKSHSVVYSYLAYQTAWLKSHYPAEFIAANLSAEVNNQTKMVLLIEEAKKFDIKVHSPNINTSGIEFQAKDNNIYFGMAGISGVGRAFLEPIIEERKMRPFESLFDLCSRVPNLNRRALEALICSGAFDHLHDHKRAAMFEAIDTAIDFGKSLISNSSAEMDSLFGGASNDTIQEPTLPIVKEWDEDYRLEKEKEYLNFYFSGHPLEKFRPYVEAISQVKFNDIESPLLGNKIRVMGFVTGIRTRLDKNNNRIAFIAIEDFYTSAECIFWSDAYKKYQNQIQLGDILICSGTSEEQNDKIKIVVDEVLQLDEAIERFIKGYNIWIDLDSFDELKISALYALQANKDGKSDIVFNVFNYSTGYRRNYIAYDVEIPANREYIQRIIDILGIDSVKLLTD